jgi:hypothetical protein
MANELKGGSRTSFSNSLAEMIEIELDNVRSQYGLEALTSENKEDLRPLLLGISRGIVRYLGDNPEAFMIDGSSVETHGTHAHSGSLSAIDTDPT